MDDPLSRVALRGCFVTGTDTGAGKTVLAAAIVAALRASGRRVGAFKPVVTGIDEPDATWPADQELLAAAAGARPQDVCGRTFGPAVSPHLAAQLAGVELSLDELAADARAAAARADAIIVEGVGLPLVVAARPGLGTINHSLLTLAAARAAGLEVRAVVLTPWPARPSAMQESNRATIARRGGVAVHTLATVAPDVADLARAGAGLPLEDWIGP